MPKVTSKYQVTVPRAIADQFNIRPGDTIEWVPAGEAIRVQRTGKLPALDTVKDRLRWFDKATERHRARRRFQGSTPRERGWTREDLYRRGRAD
jgi:AbrB family looped-hinge helix DNA binding protein